MREIRRKLGILLTVVFMTGMIFSGCDKEETSELQKITIEEDTAGNEEKSVEETNTGEVTENNEDKTSKSEKTSDDTSEIWVYVCGAVNAPGVYSFNGEIRIFEAIEKAGGMTETAAANYLNQAQIVADGEQIYVPTQADVDAGNTTSNPSMTEATLGAESQADGKVNLNTATKEELMTLSGIGEMKANSIISYRESNGSFQSIEDIMLVEGIKEGVFQKVKDSITV